MSTQPYLLYGIVKLNGQIQTSEYVIVENLSSIDPPATIQTDDEGEYIIDLGDTTKFPNTYTNGDTFFRNSEKRNSRYFSIW
jgi:hypothetical protein